MKLYPANILLDNMFSADFNANDFFDYSTACAVSVAQEDFSWMHDIIDKYNQDGLNACIAYIQNREPLKVYLTQDFESAMKKLKSNNQKVRGDVDYNFHGYDIEGPYRKIEIC